MREEEREGQREWQSEERGSKTGAKRARTGRRAGNAKRTKKYAFYLSDIHTHTHANKTNSGYNLKAKTTKIIAKKKAEKN